MFNITPDEAKEKFTSLTFNGKKLVPDIFARAEFFYVAEIKVDQTVKLTGIFKIKNKEIPIEEVDCLFPGPPAGFIKGFFVYFIGSDVTFKELKRLPCVINLEELEEIKQEDLELVIFGEELIKQAPPVLTLLDPFGITAGLNGKKGAADLTATGYEKRGENWVCRSDRVHESLSLLSACGWTIQTAKGEMVVPFDATHLSWEEEGEFIELKGEISFNGEKVDITKVDKQRQVKLDSGKIGLLPDNFKLPSPQNRRVRKEKMGLIADLIGESFYTDTRKKRSLITKMDQNPGPDFKGELRPYQKQGLSWLQFLYQNKFAGFLADDMGLGKTIQTLAFISLLPADKPILIVVPSSLQFNWLAEIRKFLPAREPQITITSYTQLRLKLPFFETTHWEMVILDEAQAVKNDHTQTFKAVKSLNSEFRLSISGTPVENHLSELVTHFKFLLPKLELSEDLYELKKLTAPFILRRRKEQVLLELPEKIEETVWVDFSSGQQEIYDRYLQEARSSDLHSLNNLQILEVILRLRQIACHPKLAGFQTEESAKMQALLEDIEILVSEGRKVLVFSQFTSMLSLIAQALLEKGQNYLLLTGETKNREEVVNHFQHNAAEQIFLVSLKAGGVGLNLTAADTVLLFDPWWNLAIEEQAISRAHRMGQRNSVLVKRYVSRGTIEEKIIALKETKKNLADFIISEESRSNNELIELVLDELL